MTQRDWDDARLINAALDIHHDDPEFGYRLIADELRAWATGRVRTGSAGCAPAADLLVVREETGLTGKPGPPVHDDLVERKFTADDTEHVVAHRHHRAPHR